MSSPITNWIVAIFNFAASTSCFFFLTAILTNKTTRSNAFNLYVAFMLLPDALLTLVSCTFNISRALAIRITPPMEVNVFVNFVYFIVNFNANAVVTYEINKLITQSNMRRRTKPPDLSRVYTQMFCVYLVAITFGLWGALPVSWSIYHVIDPLKGEGKLGSPPGGPITFLAAATMTYGLFVIPALVYVICISIRVWTKKLLPRKGRTRMLSVFFMRVVFVFLLFYVPNATLVTYKARLESETAKYWLTTTRGLLSAAQASTTLYLVSVKDDIRKVIIDQYNCTFGRLCCRISTTTRKRESVVHVSGSVQVSSNVRISSINANSAVSHNALWPSTASKSLRQSDKSQEQLPQQSEWDAEDEYDEDDSNDENTRTVDAGNGHSTAEESSRFSSVNMAGELIETSRRDDSAV